MSLITAYYRGLIKDTDGRNLQDMWNLYDDFESCHSWVQWAFPLPEPSDFNPDAPLLSEDDIKIFKADPEIRENLIHSVELIMKFWGMDLNVRSKSTKNKHTIGSVSVEFDPDDKETAEVGFIPIKGTKNFEPVLGYSRDRIFGGFNHNHLRMTRVLLCLTLCGLEQIAAKIYDFLSDHGENIPGSCWEHWDKAIVGKSVPRPPKPKMGWVQGPTQSAQSIKDTYWESAKADYNEIMLGAMTPGEKEDLKVKWFDAWAKKLIQMSQEENLWDETK